eukprot:m.65558 g.65558  ORF g.65558 m.65558 type:complete len:245 (-) comp15924_c0_seq4:134-868(-)
MADAKMASDSDSSELSSSDMYSDEESDDSVDQHGDFELGFVGRGRRPVIHEARTSVPTYIKNMPTTSHIVHQTTTLETADHEDHTFSGIFFNLQVKNDSPISFVRLDAVAVRGSLGLMRVFVAKGGPVQAVALTNSSCWDLMYEKHHKPSMSEPVNLFLNSPVVRGGIILWWCEYLWDIDAGHNRHLWECVTSEEFHSKCSARHTKSLSSKSSQIMHTRIIRTHIVHTHRQAHNTPHTPFSLWS